MVQTFWPLITQTSPSRSALVCKAGDVGAGAGLGEHLAPDGAGRDGVGEVGGCFCSWVPYSLSIGTHMPWEIVNSDVMFGYLPYSSRQMRSCSLVRLCPPYSLG